MASRTGTGRHWWEGPGFERFLADLLASEVARLRRGSPLQHHVWTDSLQWGPDGLDLDSLERLRLAMAVGQALALPGKAFSALSREVSSFGGMVRAARAAMAEPPPHVAFLTSGSTGEPKRISHGWASLDQEVTALAGVLGMPRRIVSCVPSHHIYGFLFTVLLPHRLGIEVVDARGSLPLQLAASCRDSDLIIAVPPIWQNAAHIAEWPQGITAVSSGSACQSGIARQLRGNGLSRLIEIYGSTETGGIGWRDHEDAPYQLLSYWSRHDETHLVKPVDGTPHVFELPDHVFWAGPQHLTPSRRRDAAVQIHGINVYPDFVRSVLSAHPMVAEASVRPMRPDEGDRLKAFIVLKDQKTEDAHTRAALENWLRERLNTVELPRSLTFGSALPRSPSGKLKDWIIDAD